MIKWKIGQNICNNYFTHVLFWEQVFFCSILQHGLVFCQCRYHHNGIKMAVGTGSVFESVFRSWIYWSFSVCLHEDIKDSRTAELSGNYQCFTCCFFPPFPHSVCFNLIFSVRKKEKQEKSWLSPPFFYNPSIVSYLI